MLRDAARESSPSCSRPGAACGAQFNWVGAGSTAQGDLPPGRRAPLSFGIGLYNLNTAQGNAINVDTDIRWNEVRHVLLRPREPGAAGRGSARGGGPRTRRAARRSSTGTRTPPRSGTSRTAIAAPRMKLNELLDPGDPGLVLPLVAGEALGRGRPPDPVPDQRLRGPSSRCTGSKPRGTGKWPVALQDDRFAHEPPGSRTGRRRGHRSSRSAGRCRWTSSRGVKEAIEGLSLAGLDAAVAPGKDQLYRESKERIKELR